MPLLKDDSLLGEAYSRIIGQSQARDEAGIGTIVQGNPFNTKIALSQEQEESVEYNNFEKWENDLSAKFPSAQLAWERNLCRALVNSVPIGFFDKSMNTGYLSNY